MASTFEQAEAALRDYQTVMGRLLESGYTFVNEFKSIDTSSPTAISQFAEIEARWDAKVEGKNAELSSSLAILNSVVDNLPPDGFFGSAKADFKKQVENTRAEIIKLNKTVRTEIGTIGIQIEELKKAAAEKTKTEAPAPAPASEPEKAAVVNDDTNPNGFEAAEAEKLADSSQTSGQYSAGSTVVNSPSQSSAKPGPKPNPLGNLSSYTYGLSLYMVNPETMNKFIDSGGTMVGIAGSTRGVRVVAQSGGISQSDKTLTSFSGTQLEYYIDDLQFTTLMAGGMQRASPSTIFKFKIIEPYGFSFLQDITRAGFELNAEGGINAPKMNGIQQHFIIGIKFYGYDVDGKVITQVPSDPKGSIVAGQLPERYFAITIRDMKFKLDGRMITYNCEAIVVSEEKANGQINGILKSTTTLNGSTIWEVLANPANPTSLVSVLNSSTESDKDRKQVKIPTKYSIEFLDENKKVVGKDSVIGKAKLINDATFDNTLAPTLKVSSSERATIAQQFKAVSIDGSKVSLQQAQGKHLLTVIDNIITKSEFISAALKQVNTAGAETVTKDQVPKILEWYVVNPVISISGFDEKTNDWAYEIKYQIMPYQVPYVRTTNATRTSTYPGPSKRYEYWLTGKNSEIISYEQQYNKLFYIATPANSTISSDEPPKTGSVPVQIQNAANGDSSGSKNKQFEYNKEVAAQIYSPGDQSKIKIKIMGDPDYIMSLTGVNYAQTLGQDRAGIDILKGQIFIEIKFLMASDYGENGLLDISDKIQFFNAKSEILKDLKIDGVPYRVDLVESIFSKGSFTQTLTCVMVDQDILSKPTDSKDGGSGTTAGSGNQRSEADAEIARLASKYPPPANNQSGAETARLSRQNSSLIRPGATNPSSFDTRRADIVPVTSTSGGAQPINPKTLLPLAPSKNNGLGSGLGSAITNSGQQTKGVVGASDDQFKATPSQLPDNRPRGYK